LNESYSNLQVGFTVGTGKAVPFFSGDVSASYGTAKQLKSQAKIYNSIFSAQTNKHSLDPDYGFAAMLPKLVKPDSLTLINDSNIDPYDLFDGYGTHIILSCSIGGSARITGIYDADEEATDSNIEAALNFKSSYVNGEAKTTIEQKAIAAMMSSTIKISASGGDFSLLAGARIENMWDKLEDWQAALKKIQKT
jgi:hypothetical protein